jgi:DNA-binding NarL/FixJ family response regulator
MLRVVVVDDQELLRAGLVGIINTASDLRVVGEAGDGGEAVRVVEAQQPEVVLMDIRMPGTDGLEATRRITARTRTRVIILTTFDLDDYVYTALRHGASGFLLKDTPPADLLQAIRVVAAGDALLSPAVTRTLVDRFTREPVTGERPTRTELLEGTTEREREVLALIAQGATNQEIAQQLHISAGTTKTHVGHLLAKLGARDRVHLVIKAHQAGLADLRTPPAGSQVTTAQ